VILPRRGVGALTQDGIQSQGDHEFVAGESQEQEESQPVDDDGDAEDEEGESDHPRAATPLAPVIRPQQIHGHPGFGFRPE
jgi:hypothetical protein